MSTAAAGRRLAAWLPRPLSGIALCLHPAPRLRGAAAGLVLTLACASSRVCCAAGWRAAFSRLLTRRARSQTGFARVPFAISCELRVRDFLIISIFFVLFLWSLFTHRQRHTLYSLVSAPTLTPTPATRGHCRSNSAQRTGSDAQGRVRVNPHPGTC